MKNYKPITLESEPASPYRYSGGHYRLSRRIMGRKLLWTAQAALLVSIIPLWGFLLTDSEFWLLPLFVGCGLASAFVIVGILFLEIGGRDGR